MVEKHALPVFGPRPFVAIARTDIADLLDDVAEESGAPQADKVLAHLSSLSNWFAARHATYSSPIVKGMKRSEAKGRERILDDKELKVIWATAAKIRTPYAGAARFMLLTAQRRAKIASIRFSEIGDDGLWSIQTLPREKENPQFLLLPATAIEIIRSRPVLESKPFVFPGRGKKAMNSWSQMKREFDEHLPKDFANWTNHDLRRTARSLMSRAGVPSDLAERVLGHTLPGVLGIYDRHTYATEKKAALAALETLILEIVQ